SCCFRSSKRGFPSSRLRPQRLSNVSRASSARGVVACLSHSARDREPVRFPAQVGVGSCRCLSRAAAIGRAPNLVRSCPWVSAFFFRWWPEMGKRHDSHLRSDIQLTFLMIKLPFMKISASAQRVCHSEEIVICPDFVCMPGAPLL